MVKLMDNDMTLYQIITKTTNWINLNITKDPIIMVRWMLTVVHLQDLLFRDDRSVVFYWHTRGLHNDIRNWNCIIFFFCNKYCDVKKCQKFTTHMQCDSWTDAQLIIVFSVLDNLKVHPPFNKTNPLSSYFYHSLLIPLPLSLGFDVCKSDTSGERTGVEVFWTYTLQSQDVCIAVLLFTCNQPFLTMLKCIPDLLGGRETDFSCRAIMEVFHLHQAVEKLPHDVFELIGLTLCVLQCDCCTRACCEVDAETIYCGAAHIRTNESDSDWEDECCVSGVYTFHGFENLWKTCLLSIHTERNCIFCEGTHGRCCLGTRDHQHQ